MRITKIGHCALLIEERNVRILTDPGNLSSGQDELTGLNLILITHEHADHCHIDSVRRIMHNNPNAKILTNDAVGALLAKDGIPFTRVSEGEKMEVGGVAVEGRGKMHAEILEELPRVANTGFYIGDRLFLPGDSLEHQDIRPEALALPVAGPWLKISEAVTYAKRMNPRMAFPIHDGMLKKPGPFHEMPARALHDSGIDFRPLTEGQTLEI